MRHLAAYLLLQIGGNASPSAKDVKKVLDAVGIEADEERLEKLIGELEGKDVNTVRVCAAKRALCGADRRARAADLRG
jgi:large subunit ribosomal protein LP2